MEHHHAHQRLAGLKGADLRGAVLNGLQVEAKDLQGAVITPAQSAQVAALLGVRVLEEGASLDENET